MSLNASLMCDLLACAVSNCEGRLALPLETDSDPEVSETVAFLVEQDWLEK